MPTLNYNKEIYPPTSLAFLTEAVLVRDTKVLSSSKCAQAILFYLFSFFWGFLYFNLPSPVTQIAQIATILKCVCVCVCLSEDSVTQKRCAVNTNITVKNVEVSRRPTRGEYRVEVEQASRLSLRVFSKRSV